MIQQLEFAILVDTIGYIIFFVGVILLAELVKYALGYGSKKVAKKTVVNKDGSLNKRGYGIIVLFIGILWFLFAQNLANLFMTELAVFQVISFIIVCIGLVLLFL